MKLSELITLVFFMAAVSFAQDCKARIIMLSDADNTAFYINGQKIGEGSKIIAERDSGIYILKAGESNKFWNPVIYYDTVHIKNCSEYSFNYKFNSQTLVRSEPVDAYLFKNDSLPGNIPLLSKNNPEALKFTKPEFKDLKTETRNIHHPLILEKAGDKNNKRFYKKDLFKYLIGGLVVLGGATAYFKLKADDKFQQYELTGEDKLLRETRRYDLISGITFGALQINFGFLLYYFLSE